MPRARGNSAAAEGKTTETAPSTPPANGVRRRASRGSGTATGASAAPTAAVRPSASAAATADPFDLPSSDDDEEDEEEDVDMMRSRPPTRARLSAAATATPGAKPYWSAANSPPALAASSKGAIAKPAASSSASASSSKKNTFTSAAVAAASGSSHKPARAAQSRQEAAQAALLAAQARQLLAMNVSGKLLPTPRGGAGKAKQTPSKTATPAATAPAHSASSSRSAAATGGASGAKRRRSAAAFAASSSGSDSSDASSSSDSSDSSSSASSSESEDDEPKVRRSLLSDLAAADGSKKKGYGRGRPRKDGAPPVPRHVTEAAKQAKRAAKAAAKAARAAEEKDRPRKKARMSNGVGAMYVLTTPRKNGIAAAAASSASAKKIKGASVRRVVRVRVEGEISNDEVCHLCSDGGALLECDGCVHSFHRDCLEEHHPDNYDTLKQLAGEDPLFCVDVHCACTSRKKILPPPPQEAREFTTAERDGWGDARDANAHTKWLGLATHRSQGRKYFRAFSRAKDVYAIGAHVLLHNPSPAPGHPPYWVARIEALWEDLSTHAKMLECRWLYLPEETSTGRLPHHHKDELFETAHVDDNEVEAVEDLCDVLDEEEYELRMRMEEEEEGGDMDDDDGEERKQSDQEAASASKKKQKNKSGANDDDAADEKSSRRRVFFMRQRYDDDRRVFRPLVREKKERGAGLRQSLAAAAAPSSKRGGASSSGGAGGKPQSIYAQACAQLQLSAAPPKLPCRDKEHQQIRDFVERGIRRGYADGGLYIAGVPGTGKTATVQRVLNELSLVPSLPNFEFVEINGMRLPEPAQLYTALWKSLTGKQASAAKACTYLEARFRSDNARRPVCVLLVDELDYMLTRQQHVLYNLFDWPSRRSARLLVIGISNTIDLPDLLMPRVHSRLGLTKLHFEPYTKEQIGLIIADRLRSLPAFGEGAVELCARKIASISGDMRRALQICRRAAEICEEQQIRAAAAASKLKGSAAAAAAAAGASASSSSSSAAAASVSASVPLVNEDHIMSAIADLQNSSFIQWLRVRAPRVPYEPLLLCAMLQGMKFASAAAGGGATVGSGRNNNGGMGDENPFVSMHALVLHATTLLDTKGYLALLSSRCDGISAAELAQNRPSVEADWARLVRQWAEVRLVHLTHLRGERHPRVQLNVLTDDIEHAYRNEPLWQHLRG